MFCEKNETFRRIMFVCCPFILLGIIGNVLVLIITKKDKEMRSPTNLLLTNISVSDLLYLLVQIPSTVTYSLNTSIHQTHGILMLLQDACYINSMVTITLLARERYMALSYALDSQRHLKKRGVKIAIGSIWFFSSIAGCSNLAHTKLTKNANRIVIISWLIVFCVVPSTLTVYYYAKIVLGICVSKTICGQSESTAEEKESKKRTVKMLLLITLFAVIVKLPFQIIYMAYLTGKIMFCTIEISWTCTCLASSLTPLVYFTMCSNYKNGLKLLCRSCSCRGRNVIGAELRTTST